MMAMCICCGSSTTAIVLAMQVVVICSSWNFSFQYELSYDEVTVMLLAAARDANHHLACSRSIGRLRSPAVLHKPPHFAAQTAADADERWGLGWSKSLHHLPDYCGVPGKFEERNVPSEYLKTHGQQSSGSQSAVRNIH